MNGTAATAPAVDVKREREASAREWTEARSLLDEAVTLPVDDPRRAELEERHDKLMDAHDRRQSTIERYQRHLSAGPVREARQEGRVESRNGGKLTTRELVARAEVYRAMARGESLSGSDMDLAKRRDVGERIFELWLRSQPDERAVFAPALRRWEQRRAEAAKLELWDENVTEEIGLSAERAALSNPWSTAVGTGDGQAGYNIPELWYAGLIKELALQNPMLDAMLSRRFTTGTAATLHITVDRKAKDRKAQIIAENTELDPTRWARTQVDIGAYKYGEAASFSFEVQRDVNFDIMADFIGQLAYSFAQGIGEHFTVGDNANKPQGFMHSSAAIPSVAGLTGSPDGVASAAGKFTAADLLNLEGELPPPYRNGALYQFHPKSRAIVRRLRDANGTYIMQRNFESAGPVGGPPMTILGYPFRENPDMPEPANAAKAVVFGDFRRCFATRVVGGMRVRYLPWPQADQDAVFAYFECDSAMLIADGFRVLTLRS